LIWLIFSSVFAEQFGDYGDGHEILLYNTFLQTVNTSIWQRTVESGQNVNQPFAIPTANFGSAPTNVFPLTIE